MGNIGKMDYPEMPLSNAVQYLNRAYRVLSEGISTDGFAQALSLKPKTGGFARVLVSLNRYGLVEGRGTIKATELAKQVLYGYTQEDREKAKARAWLNIEIIKGIYDRYGASVPERTGEFLALIGKLSGADPQEVQDKAGDVRNLYEEASRDLGVLGATEASQVAPSQPIGTIPPTPTEPTLVSPSGIIDAKVGDVWIRLPRSHQGLKTARKLLDLLEMQIAGEETSSQSPEQEKGVQS